MSTLYRWDGQLNGLHDVSITSLEMKADLPDIFFALIGLQNESGQRGTLKIDGVRANLIEGFGIQNVILSVDSFGSNDPKFEKFCELFQYLEAGGIDELKNAGKSQELVAIEIAPSIGVSCMFVADAFDLNWV